MVNPNRRLINEKAQFYSCFMLDSEKGITNIGIKLKVNECHFVNEYYSQLVSTCR